MRRHFLFLALMLIASLGVKAQSAHEIADNMIPGINLGNTLEACNCSWLSNKLDYETGWQPTKTTQKIIDYYKQLGFKSVRIPVAWYAHTGSNYTIDSAWMNRVKQIVDYCINDGLYVVLNDHWDSGWVENSFDDTSEENVAEKSAIMKRLWTQIANRFKYYDEHLIFAGLNEPNSDNATKVAALIKYEQAFIDAVRATGGNNTTRVLAVQGPNTDIDRTCDLYDIGLLNDPAEDALLLEVHFYGPYNFAQMTKDEDWGKMAYYWGNGNHMRTSTHNATWGEEEWVEGQFAKMKKFKDNGIPVIIGEYGAEWREMPAGESQIKHDASVELWYKIVTESAIKNGCVPMAWDINSARTIVNRANLSINCQPGYDGIMAGVKSAEAEATDVRSIENAHRSPSGTKYNLTGIRVNDCYHGIVIQNGVKYYIP